VDDSEIQSRFANWLAGRLRERRISQRQLAARSGVNHSTICRLLRGERDPTLSTVCALARVLGWDALLETLVPRRSPALAPRNREENAADGDQYRSPFDHPQPLFVRREDGPDQHQRYRDQSVVGG
jgi:transcriptional regulator with XRE-family HTH domain